jgi:hypothetical protein
VGLLQAQGTCVTSNLVHEQQDALKKKFLALPNQTFEQKGSWNKQQ